MNIDRYQQLKALNLYGMAAAWQEWLAQLPNQQQPVMPEVWLDKLIAAENADRQARSLNYQLKAAKFPHHRDFVGFNCVNQHAKVDTYQHPIVSTWNSRLFEDD